MGNSSKHLSKAVEDPSIGQIGGSLQSLHYVGHLTGRREWSISAEKPDIEEPDELDLLAPGGHPRRSEHVWTPWRLHQRVSNHLQTVQKIRRINPVLFIDETDPLTNTSHGYVDGKMVP